MSEDELQSRTETIGMDHLRLETDNVLTTYSRYRSPEARLWLQSLLPRNPGFPKNIRLLVKDRGKRDYLGWYGSIMFSFLMASVPYIILIIGVALIFRSFSSTASQDVYTFLFLIYCSIVMIFFMLSYHKLLVLLRISESTKYIQKQEFSYRYKFRYIFWVLLALFIVGLPVLLVLTIPDSSFISETSKMIVTHFLFYMSASLSFFLLFNFGFEVLGSWYNYNTRMITSFESTNINIKGNILGEKYNMHFTIQDVEAFILLKLRNITLLQNVPGLPRSKYESEEFRILYLIDSFGYPHLCTYYIQGGTAVQQLLSFLAKQYPGKTIEILGDGDFRDVGYRDAERALKAYSVFLSGASFMPFGIRTPFFFPSFISLKEKKSNVEIPDFSDKRVPVVKMSGVAGETGSAFISSFKKLGKSEISYRFKIILTTLICASVALVAVFLSPSVVLAFAFVMTCFTPFLPPGKRWYRPGVNFLPTLSVLLLIILSTIL